jgi:FMN phosphatase YigB (HAD superfamily)
MEKAAIVDLDGTLVNVSSIRHLVEGKKKNFEQFHARSAECPPNQVVVELTDYLSQNNFKIIIMSGRISRYLDLSISWLQAHKVNFHEIYLRDNQDFRPDFEIKRDLFEFVRQYRVQVAIDDKPNLRKLWLELGIPLVINPEGLQLDQAKREVRKL